MNIPNFPTDNLYKFLSISGIFVILVSLSSLYFNSKNLNTEIIDTNRKIRQYGYKIEDWKCEIEQLNYILQYERELKELNDSISNSLHFDSLNLCLSKSLAPLFQYFKSHVNSDESLYTYFDLEINHMINHKKVDSLEIEIEYDIKLVEYKNELLKRNKIFSIIGVFIGLICSFFGFYFWYKKSQKHLDVKLKKEAEN